MPRHLSPRIRVNQVEYDIKSRLSLDQYSEQASNKDINKMAVKTIKQLQSLTRHQDNKGRILVGTAVYPSSSLYHRSDLGSKCIYG